MTRTFAGDKKDGESILGTYEKKAVANTVRLGYVALNTLVFFTGTDISGGVSRQCSRHM
jgi:hypothetical protein